MASRLTQVYRRLPAPLQALVQPVRRWQHRRERILKTFHLDPASVGPAYFLLNGYGPRSLWRYSPELFRRALDFGYLSWPRKIRNDLRGARVLEVGCGKGTHAVGYALVGVKSYLGMDPKLDLDSKLSKDRDLLEQRDFGWTPRQISKRLPHVQFMSGIFEDLAPDGKFDVAVMHNVTEHLLQIEHVFEEVRKRIRPGGLLIYNHHNFYCWNGHHQKPKFVDRIDPQNLEHGKFMDWQHLIPEAEKDRHMNGRLNRIRLDELRSLTEKHFEIETWDEQLSDANRGAGRLTDGIRARHPDVTEREFTTQGVFCRARRPA